MTQSLAKSLVTFSGSTAFNGPRKFGWLWISKIRPVSSNRPRDALFGPLLCQSTLSNLHVCDFPNFLSATDLSLYSIVARGDTFVFVYLFIGGARREEERARNIGSEPATQAGAPTGQRASDLSLRGRTPCPLSHTGRGRAESFRFPCSGALPLCACVRACSQPWGLRASAGPVSHAVRVAGCRAQPMFNPLSSTSQGCFL